MDCSLNFVRREADSFGVQMVGLAGLAGFLGAMLLGHAWSLSGNRLLLLFLFATAAPMVLLSLLILQVYRRTSTELQFQSPAFHWPRVWVKYVGLLLTFLFLAMAYRFFPQYMKDFYHPFWGFMEIAMGPFLLAALPYIAWVDARMKSPEDGYWHMGLVALGRWREVDWKEVKSHALGWLVKGFFLPFMIGAAMVHLEPLVQDGLDWTSFDQFYVTGLNLILAVDVVFGCIGYLLTLRVLDSHIRTTESTLLGWLVALSCYPPFATFLWKSFLSYKAEIQWQGCFDNAPILYISWGFLILILHGVYSWSTCCFGYRFSNLTNRGIIVDGPYRYLKHPAYVCKNLAWWLMFVPFITHVGWWDAVRASVCQALTNGIYALRAWTEERHLKSDPAYVAYSQWMAEHSLWAHVKRWCHPAIRRTPWNLPLQEKT